MALFLARGTVIASRRIFESTLQHVLHNPMSFFDRTPIGRILSRLGKDIDVIDNILPVILRSWMTCLFSVWYSHITTNYCISNDLCDSCCGLILHLLLVERHLLQISIFLFIFLFQFTFKFTLKYWHFARSILVTFYYMVNNLRSISNFCILIDIDFSFRITWNDETNVK